MRNWRFWQSLTILLFTAIVIPPVAAASVPFLPHIQAAVIRTLESEVLVLSGASDPQFVRYDALGRLETFQCPSLAAFQFRPTHSGMGGRITIGDCPKDAQLNENMAEAQAKGFEAAVSAAGGDRDIGLEKVRMTLGDEMKPQVIQDRGTVFVHLAQLFIPGVGGVGGHGAGAVETMLMIPPGSKTVILVQGGLTNDICLNRMELPLCHDFRGAMREVARQVQVAQTSPVPPPAFRLESLRPGRPTICDSIARAVAEALEQSDAKQVPVTDTIRYKQSPNEPDSNIQAFMRNAADKHAQGMDISSAAKNVGEECYSKWFKK